MTCLLKPNRWFQSGQHELISSINILFYSLLWTLIRVHNMTDVDFNSFGCEQLELSCFFFYFFDKTTDRIER